ncbi:MAG: radical SAM protein [Candidatus Electrothrix sp. AUS4]|nr:radical SAM protein [Candidatus Electrothrix sp. AUS4]
MERLQKECLGEGGDDLSRYLAKAAATLTPLSASFELTRRCNFRCVHCYLGDQEAIHKHRHRELDTEAILGLLDEMVEAGTLFLTLTGGDPMIRPDFIRIYEYAVRVGLLVSVYCNGSLITEEIIASFAKYPPRVVEVTLYGATAKTFETITQKQGSFSACMIGIERLRRANVRLRLKTMVMTLNSDEVSDLWRVAEEMGVQFRHDCSIIPVLPNEDNDSRTNINRKDRNKGLKENLQFRLTPEQAAAIDFGVARMGEKIKQLLAQETLLEAFSKKLYHCGAGRSSYHITPYGNMQPCIITLHSSYDIMAEGGTVIETWKKLSEQVVKKQAEAGFTCNRCGDRAICTGCPSSFILESEKLDKAAPFYCDYAKCRRQISTSSL